MYNQKIENDLSIHKDITTLLNNILQTINAYVNKRKLLQDVNAKEKMYRRNNEFQAIVMLIFKFAQFPQDKIDLFRSFMSSSLRVCYKLALPKLPADHFYDLSKLPNLIKDIFEVLKDYSVDNNKSELHKKIEPYLIATASKFSAIKSKMRSLLPFFNTDNNNIPSPLSLYAQKYQNQISTLTKSIQESNEDYYLPTDAILEILSHTHFRTKMTVGRASRFFFNIANVDLLWKDEILRIFIIDEAELIDLYQRFDSYKKIFCTLYANANTDCMALLPISVGRGPLSVLNDLNDIATVKEFFYHEYNIKLVQDPPARVKSGDAIIRFKSPAKKITTILTDWIGNVTLHKNYQDSEYYRKFTQEITAILLPEAGEFRKINLKCIDGKLVIDELPRYIIRLHQLCADIDVGFGNALFITGSDPKLGKWKKAIRLSCVNATRWVIDLRADLFDTEFKFLLGSYNLGSHVSVSKLTWEQGDNRRIASSFELNLDLFLPPSYGNSR